MFSEDIDDPVQVAEGLVQHASSPGAWLSQAESLKAIADDIIDRWAEAMLAHRRARMEQYERFPVEYYLDREAGETVPPRPGEEEYQQHMRLLSTRVLHGSPEVYMMLMGFAVENVLKGLYIAKTPDAIADPEDVAEGRSLLDSRLGGGHRFLQLAGEVGVDLPDEEKKMLDRLEGAVLWRGRHPVPKRESQARVEPFEDDESTRSPGAFSTAFRPTVDSLFDRLHRRLHELVPEHLTWGESVDRVRRGVNPWKSRRPVRRRGTSAASGGAVP